MTTPKQITYKLVRYARKHPETDLAVFEIPQIPGYRRMSHSPKGIDESLLTTLYAIPIVLLNPYLAGGLFVDYLVRGRYHPIPKHPEVLGPDDLSPLTAPAPTQQNSVSAAASAGQVFVGGLERRRTGPRSCSRRHLRQRRRREEPIPACKELEQPMSKSEPQNLKSHGRLDPPYHFVLFFVLVANLVVAIVHVVHHHRNFYALWLVVLSLAAFIAHLQVRTLPA